MSVRKYQNGFTVIEVLLVVIAITLLIGVGLYGYNSIKNKDNENKKTSQNSKDTSNVKQTTNKEYIEFPDLGVKIEKTANLEEFTFEKDPAVPSSRYVHNTEYTKAIKACGGAMELSPDASSNSISAFGRIDGSYNDNDPDIVVKGGLVKQFDNFYISSSFPNGGILCNGEENQENSIRELRAKLNDRLDKALGTLQEIN